VQLQPPAGSKSNSRGWGLEQRGEAHQMPHALLQAFPKFELRFLKQLETYRQFSVHFVFGKHGTNCSTADSHTISKLCAAEIALHFAFQLSLILWMLHLHPHVEK
jgi:hypothetical protein